MTGNTTVSKLIVSGLVLLALTADAQTLGGTRHVGILWLTPPSEGLVRLEEALRGLASTMGQQIVIERRVAGGRADRLSDLARELVALKVEVIVTQVNRATRAAKEATATIPIVMVASSDPVGQGFITSLARPGGNITGLTWDAAPEMVGKNLGLIRELVPNLMRVAVLWNPTVPGLAQYRQAIESGARASGVSLQWVHVTRQDDFEPAFAAMASERAGALMILGDPLFSQHAAQIAKLAAVHRLPAIHWVRTYPESDGLMSYGPVFRDFPRRAVAYVEKILRGAKPGDLPVEQPTRYELVINLKTAKALALTIPQSILVSADEIIQ